ncbi:hypothetical protein A2696_01375 [Candidatus Curtissbacteria bacterium RIFCSPHIGHO2_01_FULL_41_13]|uniref:Methyltransferase domain-containing protein n=1 Tax=Candidatus Curtissbacteria bacterium RIFCSPHIGHO2_01_FULL_41_13 TaxID=1797745 RepID=A0A1F5FY06_9BACT|nr:MAG: hypothetical protein A2696_01375 [Candidatus Curtissbacteria bacterium RIFCSPHIGHO2_01_FULL_41_13]
MWEVKLNEFHFAKFSCYRNKLLQIDCNADFGTIEAVEPDLKEIEKFAESAENSKVRADLWGDFVGWDNRRRGENGWLFNQLKNYSAKKVLDVAVGDGVDTIFLLKQGFEVNCNEFDSAFREKAKENVQREGLVIAPTVLDWRNLDEEYLPASQDAVICMGNSLTCLEGEDNQLLALGQFHRVLASGGVLLVDERNYQKILDNREAAIAGTLDSTGKYLYTGTNRVRARFISISDQLILIEYTHQGTARKAYYKVFPFKKGELETLLKEAGFSQITKFSDYEEGDNPDADFYQYVCVR